jgi:CheY-like chemotaxis protein
MGGTISVQSVYGKGSTFKISLPFTAGTNDDLPKRWGKTEDFTAPDAKVLIVDDVDINIEITEYILSKYGIASKSASDGQCALDLVKSEHFDLILMDHMMPIMDGLEATREIRALGGDYLSVPIVALTANAIEGNDKIFIEAGMNDFVSKPIDDDDLKRALFRNLPKELIKVQ